MPETELSVGEWPAHLSEERPWSPMNRPSRREDRMVTSVTVSLPPLIADLDYVPPRELVPALDSAKTSIIEMDRSHGAQLGSIGRFLMRTESVASSKIEGVGASNDDFARAIAGVKSNESAVSMVSATVALEKLVASTDGGADVTLDAILDAHHTLMENDLIDRLYAGMLRPMQNWISGNSQSPLNAVHVPPPPETVHDYLNDLLAYANRNDVDAIVQAAIVHAQFESIHPFTDGNGRIGRALIGAILRRRNLTTVTVVPIASAFQADVDRYFSEVNRYRTGEVTPFIRSVAIAGRIASGESAASAATLGTLPTRWAEISTPRAGSAAARILGRLVDHPVMSMTDAIELSGASVTSAFDAMNRLEAAGVVHEVTGRKRDRVWAATDALSELDALGSRIGAAFRAHS